MSWNKPVIAIRQETISPILCHWLVSGMIIVCIGMTGYVLWSGYIRPQQWRIIFGVVGLIWLAAFGLRLYLFGDRLEIYHFWHQERQYIDRVMLNNAIYSHSQNITENHSFFTHR
ncbi:hypothetical protein [Photorhabdus luminescens]|uniref:Uncharacterized protein n=1 Tax=Photorhabdus luminescens subsp. sonorensis TaxID=1173677 RepID=A0A5C4RM86_PHOLU|nr:hypothetical protein [Photorhabdus luminescens]TNH44879.1 hypothetical protein EP164_03510 [Photorhabdus luminescens subsp. sonorensis]